MDRVEVERIKSMYKEYREKIISERTRQEAEIQAFAESLKKADPKLFEGKVEIPEEVSLQALIPELYVEHPDPQIYEQQYNKAKEFFDCVNAVIESVYEEAKKCLQEYQEISLGR